MSWRACPGVVIACATVFAACWSSPSAPTAAPVSAEDDVLGRHAEPAEAPGPLPARTIWQGYYDCAQGTTGVQLTIDREAPDRAAGPITAIFDFGAHRGNPDLPSGSYRLTGTLREADRALVIELTPDRWILQPPDYVMVGVAVTSDRRHRQLRGRLLHADCGTIQLERTD